MNIVFAKKGEDDIVSCWLRVAIPKYTLFPGIFILELIAIKTDQGAGLFCMDKMTVFL